MGWNARRWLCTRVLHRAHDASIRCIRAITHHHCAGEVFDVPFILSLLTLTLRL